MDGNIIIGIISLIISMATFLAMILGVNLGKKALAKNETLFGKEAEDRYNSIKDKLPKDGLYYDGIYEGGNKITPQFETERFYFDQNTMGNEWKGTIKTVRYYYPDNGKIKVKSWRIK